MCAGLGRSRLKRGNHAIRAAVDADRKVGRIGRAGNINALQVINRESRQTIRSRTAQISRIDKLLRGYVQRRLQRRIDHRNENILRSIKSRLVGRVVRILRVEREVRRRGRARDVNISGGIDRHLRQALAAPAQVSRITQHGVDDEFAAVVVVSDREADFVAGQLAKTSRDRVPAIARRISRCRLINARRAEAHISLLGRKNQISRSPCVNAGGSALKAQRNLLWIAARRHAKVILQLSLIAVVHQIDARIHRRILHPPKLRNVLPPLGRIVANKVIALARQRRSPGNAGRRTRPLQPHPNHRTCSPLHGPQASHGRRMAFSWPLQLQHRFVGRQKQAVARSARQKLNRSGGLTLVRFEKHRQREIERRRRGFLDNRDLRGGTARPRCHPLGLARVRRG